MALQLYKIATVEVGSAGASTIDFTSIPQGYTDLKLVLSGRGNLVQVYSDLSVRVNSNTSGYSSRSIYGDGAAAASASNITGTDRIYCGTTTGANATANTFNSTEIYIPNYAGSTNKSISIDTVAENNATTAYSTLTAGLWSNTAAITAVNLLINSTYTFQQYSTATLYGIL